MTWAGNVADNTPDRSGDGDILDFYRHGDVAPDARFLYRYFEQVNFRIVTIDKTAWGGV